MNVTAEIIAQIKTAMNRRTPKGKKVMNNGELAELLGYDKSWATRFLKGHIASLSRENAVIVEKALNIRFITNELTLKGHYSTTAQAAAIMADNDPHFRSIVEAYCLATQGVNTWGMDLIHPKGAIQPNTTTEKTQLKVADKETNYITKTKPTPSSLIEDIADQAVQEALQEQPKKNQHLGD